MGLRIMRYRAGMIGGSLGIQREQDGGTTVVCTVHASGPDGVSLPPKAARKKRIKQKNC
jgi:signal transduction histidine kinase